MALSIDSPTEGDPHPVVLGATDPNLGRFCASGEAFEDGLNVAGVLVKCFQSFDPSDPANANPPLDATPAGIDVTMHWRATSIPNARCEGDPPLPSNVLGVWFIIGGENPQVQARQFTGQIASEESC